MYLMCRAFLPAMTGRGTGDIINIASVSGKRPLPRRTPTARRRWRSSA
ncbi:SDR family NAD(P)-dependent oxidoreductase [Streptomyces sp. M19]